MLNKLTFCLIICLIIVKFGTSDNPIISFNVFEREGSSGEYFATLLIPSLQIKVETNLTQNKSNEYLNDYRIDLRIEEPFVLEASGVVNTSIDSQSMAKIYDIILESKTIESFKTRGRTSISKNTVDQTIISTNFTIEDRLNKINARYNSTLILSESCPTITLFHNLTTNPDNSLLYFSSNVSEVCDLDTNSSQMSINISLSSYVWEMANMELQQIFNFGKNNGSESMNASHTLMDVLVVADWDRSAQLIHYKKAVFISKIKDLIPDFEIEFKKYKQLPNQLILTIFKEVPNLYTQQQTRHKALEEL